VKAVVCTRYGPPEVLRVEDVPVPTPRGNEVRIRVAAVAVTSSDCYVRGLDLPARYRVAARLALGLTRPRRPVLGMVLAGRVDSAGAGVSFRLVSEQNARVNARNRLSGIAGADPPDDAYQVVLCACGVYVSRFERAAASGQRTTRAG
jgi:NADPH:quinone reductase-like Zn-dependent oxidoreductase